MNRLSRILLVLGLCMFMGSTMWGQFSVSIIATDGIMADTLILGNAVGATFGVDAGLGEVENPPVPYPGIFDFRSGDWGTYTAHGQGLKKDLRPFRRAAQTDSFHLTWQITSEAGPGAMMNISWPAGLQAIGGGYWHLMDDINGRALNIDMTQQFSINLTPSYSGFFIVYGDANAYQTASYYRLVHEVDNKGKVGKPTKPDAKKYPTILPNIHTIGLELDKSDSGAVGYQMGTDRVVKGVHLKKYGDVLKSAVYAKDGTIHYKFRSCLDSGDAVDAKKGTRKFIGKKNLSSMPPVKGFQNNALFAELMVTQFNIKLNDAKWDFAAKAKVPLYGPSTHLVVGHDAGPKFVDLYINAPTVGDPLHNWDGKQIKALATDAGNALSCIPTVPDTNTMKEYQAALKKINESFIKNYPDTGITTSAIAKLDTASPWFFKPPSSPAWDKIHRIRGIAIANVGCLVANLPAVAGGTVIPRTVATTQPEEYSLAQNYPNPFNPTTQISFNLVEKGFVTVKIFNLLGQEVAQLVNHEEMEAGPSEIVFDASSFSSGVYFYQVMVNDEAGALKFQAVKKMMLVK